MHIGIVGAGIAGKLCARSLRAAGHDVAVFDGRPRYSESACSFVAAGLLTPLAEAANGDPAIAALGFEGMTHWRDIAADLNNPDIVDLRGSVSLTFASDQTEFQEFEKKLAARGIAFQAKNKVANSVEEALEQENLRYHIIEGEGKVDTSAFQKILLSELEKSGVKFFFSYPVAKLAAGLIQGENGEKSFDMVIDCRGVAARSDLEDLRGVRGEVIHLRAPEVRITRPVRVLHPRTPVYIVPRANNEYVIGATSIESEDEGPITVKSALDLLNGIYNIHHGFRYAAIIKTASACRPAFLTNLPRIDVSKKLIRVNGLYRHGFLLGPMVADTVGRLVSKTSISSVMQPYVREL